jgi:hypothetical protein
MSADSFARWRQSAPSSGFERRTRPQQARTLTKWLYVLAITTAGVWTLLMWGAYAILSVGDGALRTGSTWFGVKVQRSIPLSGATRALSGSACASARLIGCRRAWIRSSQIENSSFWPDAQR